MTGVCSPDTSVFRARCAFGCSAGGKVSTDAAHLVRGIRLWAQLQLRIPGETARFG
jgi:hypothetical protein